MANLLMVAMGGALGAVLRYLVVSGAGAFSAVFPFGTLLVNVLGSFVIGLFAAAMLGGEGSSSSKLFFQTGLLGGFTTFSAFTLETLMLSQNGQGKAAIANVVLNLVLCLVGVGAGFGLGVSLSR